METNTNNITNLISRLHECIEKLEVYKHVYESYMPRYIDNAMKMYAHSKSSLIELEVISIENNIDELYGELETSILDKYEIIEAEIAELKAKEDRAEKIRKQMLPYLLHMNMLLDKESIYYTKSTKERGEDEIRKLKEEYNLE